MSGRVNAVCGIDLGSTAVKVVLVGEDGQILAQHSLPCPLYTAAGGVAEQDAEDWYTLAARCVKACVSEREDMDVLALSISAQGGCLVPVTALGVPMRRALSWMDERAAACDSGLPEELIYRHTGWKWRGGFCAAKLLWMAENEPDIFSGAAYFLSTIDYVHMRLCGLSQPPAIDPSSAAITQLYNVETGAWSEEILGAVGITADRLPRIVASGELAGLVTPEAAKDCGLDVNTPVVCGGHDQYCAATGAGALKDGDMLISMGTAWAVLGIAKTRVLDMENWAASGRHVAPGMYGLMTSLTAGGALEWLRRCALNGEEAASIDETAKQRREKTADLYCLPHFSGMSYPHWQENARASYVGLGLEHDAYDMALALMEGVAMDVADKVAGYSKHGLAPERLCLAGGGARSALWTEILQAVCGMPAVRSAVTEAAGMGAAALAGVYAGVWQSLEQAAGLFGGVAPCVYPKDALCEYYRVKTDKYRRLLVHIKAFYSDDI